MIPTTSPPKAAHVPPCFPSGLPASFRFLARAQLLTGSSLLPVGRGISRPYVFLSERTVFKWQDPSVEDMPQGVAQKGASQ
jgi:hypothetical protein